MTLTTDTTPRTRSHTRTPKKRWATRTGVAIGCGGAQSRQALVGQGLPGLY